MRAGAFASRTSRAAAGHRYSRSEIGKTSVVAVLSVIGITRAGPARVASSMLGDVVVRTSSRGCFYKFPEPPGGENVQTLCFDTGPLTPVDEYVWHTFADGTKRYAPRRPRMPASFAMRILQSTIRGYIRVLDRHPRNEEDMDVHNIGRVRAITALYQGPSAGHETMERMLVYIGVRPEFYAAVARTGGFSFHMREEKTALSDEISPTGSPWFTATRIRVPESREAHDGAPFLFSDENAVRSVPRWQSGVADMSEGVAKTETPATAEEAVSLGAVVETMRQRGEARFSAEFVQTAKAEIEAAVAARDEAAAKYSALKTDYDKLAEVAAQMRDLLVTHYCDTIEHSKKFDGTPEQAKYTALRDTLKRADLAPDAVASSVAQLALMSIEAEHYATMANMAAELEEARRGAAKRPRASAYSATPAPLAAPAPAATATTEVGFCLPG